MYFANVQWNPSQNTTFQLNYKNSQVGGGNYYGQNGFGYGYGGTGGGVDYNTLGGNFAQGTGANTATGALGANNVGSNWNGSLQHKTRTITWNASYYTTTTTAQQYLSASSIYGNSILDTNTPDKNISLPNLTNSLMVMRRAQGSMSWQLSRSNIMLTTYQSSIDYLSGNTRPQDLYGVTASWNWRFSTRMNATVGGMWQSSEYSGTASNSNKQKTEYFSANLTITRQLSSYATGSLQFNHTESNANNVNSVSNILGTLGSYNTNQVTANLNLNY
jgi:uncharacterized protein (PEP-CTERM system associated)